MEGELVSHQLFFSGPKWKFLPVPFCAELIAALVYDLEGGPLEHSFILTVTTTERLQSVSQSVSLPGSKA